MNARALCAREVRLVVFLVGFPAAYCACFALYLSVHAIIDLNGDLRVIPYVSAYLKMAKGHRMCVTG